MFKFLYLIIFVTSCIQMKPAVKKGLNFNNPNTNNAIVEPTPGPSKTMFLESRSIQNRHGDYRFISNFLRDKFGPNSYTVINQNVLNNPRLFGGVCERYSDDNTRCKDNTINEPLIKTSTLRSGRMIKVCEEIVQSTDSVKFLMTSVSLERESEVNKENLLRVHQRFYPLAEELSSEVELSYFRLSELLSSNPEKWKTIALALCMSPGWQIL